MFGFNRKEIMMAINYLIEKNYGSYTELINLTIQELTDIHKVLMSIQQERALREAGMK